MKPIEPGCLAWFSGGTRVRGGKKGSLVEPCQTVVEAGPYHTYGGTCQLCGRNDNAWWCPSMPHGVKLVCGCMLTRIDDYEEPTTTEKAVEA